MKIFRWLMSAALLLPGAAALAHAHLEGSTPAEGTVISVSPPNLMLHFSEAARVTALTIQTADGKTQSLGPLPTEAMAHMTAKLPALAPGEYVVNWRAVGKDNHVMSGKIHFTLASSASEMPAGQQKPTSHDDHH